MRQQLRASGVGQVFGNTINHKNQGQNVLYGDGHVEFQTTCWSGAYRTTTGATVRDNIYTSGTYQAANAGMSLSGQPLDVSDSILVPTSN